ncbi:hypothetical protein G7Y89_g15336 [Cudoniella acicularis]|uniref:Uncharacterized protein n=1 Tax=Cudoniella acicularis TaxID=354080 RepID=A0A8H4QP67_9HELO|nr:hypothetical protein G7Y89_g15336 [Cudoniella acicularis]
MTTSKRKRAPLITGRASKALVNADLWYGTIHQKSSRYSTSADTPSSRASLLSPEPLSECEVQVDLPEHPDDLYTPETSFLSEEGLGIDIHDKPSQLTTDSSFVPERGLVVGIKKKPNQLRAPESPFLLEPRFVSINEESNKRPTPETSFVHVPEIVLNTNGHPHRGWTPINCPFSHPPESQHLLPSTTIRDLKAVRSTTWRSHLTHFLEDPAPLPRTPTLYKNKKKITVTKNTKKNTQTTPPRARATTPPS